MGYVIERSSPEAFIDDEPMKLISSGRFNQVPFMLGFTTAEGMLFDLFFKELGDIREIVPWSFGYEADAPETDLVAYRIQEFYFGDEEYSSKIVSKKYDVSGGLKRNLVLI